MAALCRYFPAESVFLGVVDPGVGGERLPVALLADRRWFVGPENGLLNTVALCSSAAEWLRVDWRPERLSMSFHGRDLFAPIAARIARGDFGWGSSYSGPDLGAWPADLPEIVYFDHYGNAITGTRYSHALDGRMLVVNARRIPQAETFCGVAESEAFWYRNSMDLVEIAVNRGRADADLGLALGTVIRFL